MLKPSISTLAARMRMETCVTFWGRDFWQLILYFQPRRGVIEMLEAVQVRFLRQSW
jgi:hypothetical protein